MTHTDARDEIILNFYRVRRALGYLGFFLPFLLLLVGLAFDTREPSLSDYYHTLMGDIFVGFLTAIGVFLICYTGFSRTEGERISDDIATTLAGVAALVVAYVPNRGTLNTALTPEALGQHILGVTVADYVHHAAAFVFLTSTAYICRYKFAKTDKPVRRWIYVSCSWMILAMTVATIIAATLRKVGAPEVSAKVVEWQLVFWFEALGVWAFSAAWLVKGRVDRALLHPKR